jgi:serine/threonine-protein kinase
MARFGLGLSLLPHLLDDIEQEKGKRLAPPGMVFIPGAVFLMGSSEASARQDFQDCQQFGGCSWDCFARETHQRPVLVHSFYLDATEVTNRAYATWLNNHVPYELREGKHVYSQGQLLLDIKHRQDATFGIAYENGRFVARPGHEDKPVVQVSWYGSRNYCRWLGRDLATEAQWELAARNVSRRLMPGRRRYPWGDGAPSCDGVVIGRYAGGPCGQLPAQPQDVGSAAQDVTGPGVHDLAGNVEEWVADVFKVPYPSCGWCIDPRFPAEPQPDDPSQERVVRGGAFTLNPLYGTSTSRTHHMAGYDFDGTGFRCAAGMRPAY